jgi:hypothetical protein
MVVRIVDDSSLLRAGVATSRGAPREALSQVEKAARGFDETGMTLHAAVARLRRGELLGKAGSSLVANSEARMSVQGVLQPARMAAVLAPGFPSSAP